MAKRKTSVHDSFVRKIFKDITIARDYFQHFLPADLVEKLDLSKLKAEDTSYISPQLERYFSDIVFQCPYGEQQIQLALLLEHKSTVVSYPHLQLLRYLLEKWQDDLDKKRPLQPIIPIILYHGEQKWHKRSFVDYFQGIDELLLPYLPSFDYHLTDLSHYSTAQIQLLEVGFLLNSLLVLKHIKNQEAIKKNFQLFFETTTYDDYSRQKLVIIFEYLLKNVEIADDELPKLVETLDKQLKADFMSTYDMLIQKGEKIGIQKGEKIGIQKGEKIGIQKGEKIGIEKGEKIGELRKAKQAIINMHLEGFENGAIVRLLNVNIELVEQTILEFSTKK